jgi:hypothetical protein
MTTLGLGSHGRGLGLGLSPRRRRAKSAAQPSIVQDGLVAEWRFDDGAGQALTDYKGGRHGTLGATAAVAADDPAWTARGLSFDGGDHVLLPAMPAIEAIDIVFKPSSIISAASSGRALISHAGSSYPLALGSSTGALTNEIITVIQDSGDYGTNRRVGWTHASDTISAAWHLLQLDFRSAVPSWDVVLDGIAKPVTVVGAPAALTSAVWRFGRGTASALFYSGEIAYVIAYSSARSIEQVAQNRAALTAILAARGIGLP